MKAEVLKVDDELSSFLQKGPILKPSIAAYLVEARALLEQSRTRADEIEGQAKEEFNRQKELGYQDGREAAEKAAAVHHLRTVLATIDYFDKVEQELVKTISSCIRQIVLDMPPEERIYQLTAKAIETLKQQPRIVIYVNPSDREMVATVIPRLAAALPATTMLELRVREDLKRGGCVLQSPIGLVEVTLESQLEVLESSLKRVL